jgi:glycosyltransferase involved in cell wall biosynthesis
MRVLLLNSNSMVASYTDVCNRLKEALVQYGHDVQIISIRMITDVFDANPIYMGDTVLLFKRGGTIRVGDRHVRMLRMRNAGRFDVIIMPQLFVTSAVKLLADEWSTIADKAYFLADLEGTTKGWNDEVREKTRNFHVYSSSLFSTENIRNLGVKVEGMLERYLNLKVFYNADMRMVEQFRHRFGEFMLAWCGFEKARHPRKGFEELNRAYWIAGDKLPRCVVITNQTPEQIEARYNEKIHPKLYIWNVFGKLEKQTQAALYRAATYFVATSHSEGFGLLPLESMASGTPTIYVDSRAQNEHSVGWRVPVNGEAWEPSHWELVYKYFLYDPAELARVMVEAWEARNSAEYEDMCYKSLDIASRYDLSNYSMINKIIGG